jgi:hypothetical protein
LCRTDLKVDAASPADVAAIEKKTRHLTVNATLSPRRVQPRGRTRITATIVPNPGLHVYAPGSSYRAVALALSPNARLTGTAGTYPAPTTYHYAPLNEDVAVYSRPFTLTLDVALGDVPAATRTVAIGAVLSYQACDDSNCYLPTTVPLSWTVQIVR